MDPLKRKVLHIHSVPAPDYTSISPTSREGVFPPQETGSLTSFRWRFRTIDRARALGNMSLGDIWCEFSSAVWAGDVVSVFAVNWGRQWTPRLHSDLHRSARLHRIPKIFGLLLPLGDRGFRLSFARAAADAGSWRGFKLGQFRPFCSVFLAIEHWSPLLSIADIFMFPNNLRGEEPTAVAARDTVVGALVLSRALHLHGVHLDWLANRLSPFLEWRR
jgi:hypothetical protein